MKPPTLEEVPLLSSTRQYRKEIAFLPRLTKEEEALIVEQARKGCPTARQQLIESCLLYTFVVAHRYTVYLPHDEILDLVQIGNLMTVELLDRALRESAHPPAYVRGVIRREIQQYCFYKSTLITRPQGREKPDVCFLEEEHNNLTESQTFRKVSYSQEEVTTVIEQVPDPDRTVMLRYTGLDGERPEPLKVISRRMFPDMHPTQARYIWQRGVKKISKLLEETRAYSTYTLV